MIQVVMSKNITQNYEVERYQITKCATRNVITSLKTSSLIISNLLKATTFSKAPHLTSSIKPAKLANQ